MNTTTWDGMKDWNAVLHEVLGFPLTRDKIIGSDEELLALPPDTSAMTIGLRDISGLLRFPGLEQVFQSSAWLGDEDLERLATLKNLEALELSGISKATSKGFAELARLPKLKYLEVAGSNNGSPAIDEEALANISKPPLRALRIYDLEFQPATSDDFLAPLAQLGELRALVFKKLRFPEGNAPKPGLLQPLRGIEKLEYLDLSQSENWLTDAMLEPLGESNIRWLLLNDNGVTTQNITDAALVGTLSRLTGLQGVNLMNCPKVGSKGVASLPASIEEIHVGTTWSSPGQHTRRLDDKVFAALAEMRSLRLLEIHGGSKLTDKGFGVLTSAKPPLRRLALANGTFKIRDFSGLGEMSSIESILLDLPLDATMLEHVLELRGLRDVSIDGRKLATSDYQKIARLEALENLTINGFSGDRADIEALTALPKLKKASFWVSGASDKSFTEPLKQRFPEAQIYP